MILRPAALLMAIAALLSAQTPLVNEGKPMRVAFQCSAEDMNAAGLSCPSEEPCPVYLELNGFQTKTIETAEINRVRARLGVGMWRLDRRLPLENWAAPPGARLFQKSLSSACSLAVLGYFAAAPCPGMALRLFVTFRSDRANPTRLTPCRRP